MKNMAISAWYDEIIRFVEKNQKLIHCQSEVPPRGPYVSIKDETHWAHQTEIDRLKALEEEIEYKDFLTELETSYKNNKISLHELDANW